MTTAPPILSFGEAETVGAELHDRWRAQAGDAPLTRDDMAWGDIVQFVIRRARDLVSMREAGGGR